MTEFCEHGFADDRRCPRCGSGTSEDGRAALSVPRWRARSVYQDRSVVVVVDEDWRAEQLRSILASHRLASVRRVRAPMNEVERFERFCGLVGLDLEPFQRTAMRAVLSKRREVVISQPRGNGKTTLLGCYAPRKGAVLRAETPDLLWLEWAVAEGADIDDTRTVKRANPREAITIEALAEHRRVLHDHAFRRLRCNQHLPGAAAYITAEEWDAGDGPPN